MVNFRAAFSEPIGYFEQEMRAHQPDCGVRRPDP